MEAAWKEYFVFSKKERVAVLILLVIMVALIFLPSIFEQRQIAEESIVWMKVDSVLLARESSKSESSGRSGYYQSHNSKTGTVNSRPASNAVVTLSEPFYFDPNTASMEDLKRLGLQEKVAVTIQRFVSKGGRFREARDLERVYGLREAVVKRLMPYVRIQADHRPSLKQKEKRSVGRLSIEVNSASMEDWERLPGIGPALAKRIMTFRDKLGGFHSVIQVKETYGLADSVYTKIESSLQCDALAIRKIDINQATEAELSNHPYLRSKIARAIISYRKEHGAFATAGDITKLPVVDAELFRKVGPYLTANAMGKDVAQNFK